MFKSKFVPSRAQFDSHNSYLHAHAVRLLLGTSCNFSHCTCEVLKVCAHILELASDAVVESNSESLHPNRWMAAMLHRKCTWHENASCRQWVHRARANVELGARQKSQTHIVLTRSVAAEGFLALCRPNAVASPHRHSPATAHIY